MNKGIATIIILGIGGYALYYLIKNPPKVESKTAVQPQSVATEVVVEVPSEQPVQKPVGEVDWSSMPAFNGGIESGMPDFGKPLVIENYQNYVDVKKNEYFKPQMSSFFK